MVLREKFLVLQLLIFDVVKSVLSNESLAPIVETKMGIIRGVRGTDGDYDMFMGIPYARVNMTNPFGDSIPYPKFEGIFEANDDSAQCVQIDDFHGLGGNLDCLQLNIYVPNDITPKNLPVMVYIYGGSFVQGFFSKKYYGPRFLMKYGVILVVMNYRVGSYGTLCLEIPQAPGNQALKDQVTALKWIQENIKAFGGDPGRVTLFGHSGGAASVSLQVLYAKETLFHRAIILSGSAFHPKVANRPNNDSIFKLSKYLGFETEDVEEALSFVSAIEPRVVIQAERQTDFKSRLCREIKFENVTNFMTDFPKDVKVNNNAIIPVLIGNSGDELYYLFEKRDPKYFEENDEIYNTLRTNFNFTGNDFDTAYKSVTQYYTDQSAMKITKRKVIDFFSDFYFIYPNKRFIDNYLEEGGKIYYYYFPYCGSRNLVKLQRNLTNTLATHGDELGYIFDISFPYMNKDRDEDFIVMENFLTILTNFAKYGDPTSSSSFIPKWKPVTNDKWFYMNIGTELSISKGPFQEQIAFWDQFYDTFGQFEYNSQ